MMTIFFIVFLVLAATTVCGTAAAMTLRNPVHCILALSVGLVALAGLFLQLGAQFVGFTQIMVYVGAVAILAVFAIMMTQSAAEEELARTRHVASTWIAGGLVALAVFSLLAWALLSGHSGLPESVAPSVSVHDVGDALMHRFILPLEIVGVLLTAALVGAVIVAMPEKQEKL